MHVIEVAKAYIYGKPRLMNTIRIPYREMFAVFQRILLEHGFPREEAEKCAGIFSVNSLEGIYSHGVYRFPRFIDYIRKGYIDVSAKPELIHAAGALEQWNGRLAPGPLNAECCTRRAMEIAEDHVMGCVALAHTNHWMRGGTYGWQAAGNGFAFIGWTNTEANMPAWGAVDRRLGNNPLVFAVPFKEGAIVLDFAMTQFSYGKMEAAQLEGKKLPFPGGFNPEGELTDDPAAILESWRALPIGYWKGAGLSLLLDILATILSAGDSTHTVSRREAEYGVSQVFIAIDLKKLSNSPAIERAVSDIIADLKRSIPDDPDAAVRYPGERILLTRTENLQKGIPVNPKVWDEIILLSRDTKSPGSD
jgi:3-dehydro-L-gulonate 2-dehydrogenase